MSSVPGSATGRLSDCIQVGSPLYALVYSFVNGDNDKFFVQHLNEKLCKRDTFYYY